MGDHNTCVVPLVGKELTYYELLGDHYAHVLSLRVKGCVLADMRMQGIHYGNAKVAGQNNLHWLRE